mmetsp:Transcript_9075/g.29824  ORF Transcript_9075/g.29824 Transcript_9075/m.29824 type:complete len:539 (+) Transcript_9075:17-1633(+)
MPHPGDDVTFDAKPVGGAKQTWKVDRETKRKMIIQNNARMRPLIDDGDTGLERGESRKAGILAIEAYTPRHAVSMADMEKMHDVVGKYTVGLRMHEHGSTGTDEDPVSFGLTVVDRLMRRFAVPYSEVGRLQVGSESLVDRSKSIKSNLMPIFEAHGCYDIEGVDTYHACYGGTSALLSSLDWLQSCAWDGRYAMMVATDISDAPAAYKFMSGAACVAILMGPEAPVIFDPTRCSHMIDEWDFYKPAGWHEMEPIVDGPYSVKVYMNCLDHCIKGLQRKLKCDNLIEASDYMVFHLGSSVGFVRKAFKQMVKSCVGSMEEEEMEELWEQKTMPSLQAARRIGPMHTVATYVGLYSLFTHRGPSMKPNTKINVFSYGSGSCSSMFRLYVKEAPLLGGDLFAQLDERTVHTPEAFEAITASYSATWAKFGWRAVAATPQQSNTFYLTGNSIMGKRTYHFIGGAELTPYDFAGAQRSLPLPWDKTDVLREAGAEAWRADKDDVDQKVLDGSVDIDAIKREVKEERQQMRAFKLQASPIKAF